MSIRSWLPIIGLTLCVFIFNASEFMPIGLLTDISIDLGTSESKTGLIISIYAWAVAILSLPIMLALRRMQYRRMLLMCVTLFAGFQIMSGISNSYSMLVVSRLGVAVSHSIFWSIATPLAVRVVDQNYQKLALSMVAAGTSIAMIVGLPLGRVIGLSLGWRMSFIVIAILAFTALVLLVATFPKVDNPGTFTLHRLPELVKNKALMGIYIMLAVYVTGYYTGYSYIEPFLASAAGMSENMITVVLTLFGLAGIVGSIVFTKAYDRIRYKFIMAALLGSAVCLALLLPSASSLIAILVVSSFWGFFATSFNVSFQNETLRAAPLDAAAVATSLFSGIFNVGIAMGSIIGGVVSDNASVDDIGYIGALFVLAASIFAGTYLIRHMKENDAKRDAMLSQYVNSRDPSV